MISKEYYREYRKNNREKLRQYWKIYYAINKERLKTNTKEWLKIYRQNPEWVNRKRLKNQQWRKENPEYSKSYTKKRYEIDKEFREKKKKYIVIQARKHKVKTYIRNHNYRAKRRNAEGQFTYEEWIEKLNKHNYSCVFCKTKENLTIDHIFPLSKGGTNYISNLQPLCRSCNSKKQAQILFEPIGIRENKI